MVSKFIGKLSNLNRLSKRIILIVFDSVSVVIVLIASFYIRLDYFITPSKNLATLIYLSPLIAVFIFYFHKMYQSVVRYMQLSAFWSIGQAVTLYALIWGLFGYMAQIKDIPRSVVFINWMLLLIIIGGSRFLARLILLSFRDSNKNKTNVVIYGAGTAGTDLSSSLSRSEEYAQVGFIDDALKKQGTYLNNIPVFSFDKLTSMIKDLNVQEVMIALPNISRRKRYEIINTFRSLKLDVKTLPSLSQITKGIITVDDVRNVKVEDLLGRESVEPNNKLLSKNITNKNVLVTGAGGSIGSELCRQILFLEPKTLILFEVSEAALYQIEQELLSFTNSNSIIFPVLGSVLDQSRIERIFKFYTVNTVYHAAAYKHVPIVELNPSQGVMNNAIGTKITAEAAIKSNVDIFVLISTDKAVRPSSTMGAAKRVAELVLQGLAAKTSSTQFTMVRFGNVLDSSGSVIPLFRKQIREGGPVTITDINIERYFMTIPEAVQLVIQAGSMSKGGDVFVLDMGKPVRIYDLAIEMIRLSGLTVVDEKNPDGDIAIIFTGLRPGEKLYEELLVGNNVFKTKHKLIMRAEENMIKWELLTQLLDELETASKMDDQEKIRELLIKIVPNFSPQSPINSNMLS